MNARGRRTVVIAVATVLGAAGLTAAVSAATSAGAAEQAAIPVTVDTHAGLSISGSPS